MSKFEGTWHYARQSAQGMDVVRNKATICVKDDKEGNPVTVEIEPADPNSPSLLSVDGEQTDLDISFTGEETKGRLVILSAATPALLIGSIHQPSGGKMGGPVEDHNIDVFIAVKIC
jgi:hypothetical protein